MAVGQDMKLPLIAEPGHASNGRVAALHGGTSIMSAALADLTAQPLKLTAEDHDALVGLLEVNTQMRDACR
jgi:hypothetical protein